ncbi:MAG: hypothetical protein BWZ08_01540 [candidate division BRC1 bacterium ADurb.BinA292]|nr:MAG: hypothetical protein BWZ08_01540 [candidate division BRC1 bacterium ADurb.BinA292]
MGKTCNPPVNEVASNDEWMDYAFIPERNGVTESNYLANLDGEIAAANAELEQLEAPFRIGASSDQPGVGASLVDAESGDVIRVLGYRASHRLAHRLKQIGDLLRADAADRD